MRNCPPHTFPLVAQRRWQWNRGGGRYWPFACRRTADYGSDSLVNERSIETLDRVRSLSVAFRSLAETCVERFDSNGGGGEQDGPDDYHRT